MPTPQNPAPVTPVGEGCTRFARKGEFVTRSIAGDTILVPVRGQVGDLDAIYNFNEVATFIWERLDGVSTVRDIAAAVAAEFEVDPPQAEADAMEYLRGLESAGIAAPCGQAGQK